jgi:adenylylsulfate kinase
MTAGSQNIVWHHGKVDRAARSRLLRQRGALIWLTGLPSSGKSTIAFEVEQRLALGGHLAYVLDGDNIRHGLNANLGFSPEDRTENIRRIGEVGKLFADAGVIALAAFVSPLRADRDAVRALFAAANMPFLEVHVVASPELCAERDPKGLYAKAKAGDIADFTGVSAPYEPPLAPELALDTAVLSPAEAAEILADELPRRGIILH